MRAVRKWIGKIASLQFGSFTGEQTRWMLVALLQSGAVALLDSGWVMQQMEVGAVLQRRQDLPPAAFISVEELRAIGHIPAAKNGAWSACLPIIVISYSWLAPEHPDPKGTTLDPSLVALSKNIYNKIPLLVAGQGARQPNV